MGDLKRYFGRHWRGELPIVQAYWVNTAALNAALGVIFLLLALLAKRLPLWVEPYFVGGFWAVSITILVWQSVGVVRSALRHIDESEKEWLSLLAFIAMVGIWVKTIALAWSVGVPQLTDASRILRGDPQWPDPVITVLPSGYELEYSGMIKAGGAAQLERKLDANPGIKVLHLTTRGGRTKEAESMAGVVRAHHLVTYVDQYCASAGTMVFMGGKERVLRRGAQLGFHSASAPGVPDSVVNDEQIDFLLAAKVSTTFVNKVVNTSAASIWIPTDEELLGEGIVTRVSDGSGFGLGAAALAKFDERGLAADLEQLARYRALKLRQPEQYRQAILSGVAAIRHGSDLRTALQKAEGLLRSAFQHALPRASDAALDKFVDYDLEVLRRNGSQAPREALAAMLGKSGHPAGGESPLRQLPDYPRQADDQMVAAIIESDLNQEQPVDERTVLREIATALEGISRDGVVKLALVDIPENRLEQLAACETWEKFLHGLDKLPVGEKRNLQRFLLRRAFSAR